MKQPTASNATRGIVTIAAALATGQFLAPIAPAEVEHRAEVREHWRWLHERIRTEYAFKSDTKKVLSRDQSPAPLVDEQAGRLRSDRDPTDQAARRTDALLGYLAQKHPERACWAGFRARLDPLLEAAKTGAADLYGTDEGRRKIYMSISGLRREIALANPLLDFDDIILSLESDVGYVLTRTTTGHRNGLGYKEPGNLFRLRGWKSEQPELVDLCTDAKVENGPYQGQRLAGGYFHAPSLGFDGKTIFFSWARLYYDEWPTTEAEADARDPRKKKADPLRIFRINVDGTGLRQVNCDEGPFNDTEPCELPDGRICFMSTRREVFDRCEVCRPAFTLCSMKPDGTDVIQLSFHETHEWYPSVADDGMILYSRWDYVDRALWAAHGFWTCFPDGRDARAPNGNYYGPALFKKDTPYDVYNPDPSERRKRQPMAVSHCHSIPGTRKVMGIGSAHHPVEIGQVLVMNLDLPDDYVGGQILSMTPGRWGGDPGGPWNAPYPLSEDFFLANYFDRIVLGDRFGNMILVHHSEKADLRSRLEAMNRALHGHNGWVKKYGNWKPPPNVAPKKKQESDDLFGGLDAIAEGDGGLSGMGFAEMEKQTVKRIDEKARRPPPRPRLADFVDPFRTKPSWRPTFPRPLRARARPPAIPSATFQSEDRRGGPGHQPATIVIQNVYDTDYPLPEGVKIARLRMVQVLGHTSGNYTSKLRHNSNSSPKLNLGTVPVEADGSVHCLAPIEKGIYFQLLDEDGLAVHSMKSVTYVHPGERLSCRGCHERYDSAPRMTGTPLAMRRGPSPVTPEGPGGKVLPLDDYLKPAAERVIAAANKLPGGPPTHHRELRHGGWVWQYRCGVIHAPPDVRTTPDAFGARGSKIWNFVRTHKDKLTGLEPDDIRLFALWLDLLCVDYSWCGQDSITDADGVEWPLHPDLDIDNPLGLEVVPERTAMRAGRITRTMQ